MDHRPGHMHHGDLDLLYWRRLSNTSLNRTHAWPNRFRGMVWGRNTPRRTPIRVADLSGAIWNLDGRLKFGKRGRLKFGKRGHLKPEVSGPAWRRFLSEREARKRDVLCYYRHPNPAAGAVLVLSIQREITLFGRATEAHI